MSDVLDRIQDELLAHRQLLDDIRADLEKCKAGLAELPHLSQRIDNASAFLAAIAIDMQGPDEPGAACARCSAVIDAETWAGWEVFADGDVAGPCCNDCADATVTVEHAPA